MKTHPYYFLALISLAAVILRLIAIQHLADGVYGSPVDVYYVDREAARLILELRDPYLYSHFTNRIGQIVTFAYLPMIPLYFAPFSLIGSDIRFGSIIADVVLLVAMYFIARSTLKNTRQLYWIPFTGSIAYAIFPVSILLTSVFGTNMMIGAMFLILALAALFYDKEIFAGVFLGLALATNQFVILVLPILGLYCYRRLHLKAILVSILISGVTVVPFLLYSPSRFLYDVLYFQLQRPIQLSGSWSLYYVFYALFGVKISTSFRLAIFLIPASVASVLFSSSKKLILVGIAILLALGTFILPIDGFWNYFLLPAAIVCAIVPIMITNSYVVRVSPYLRKRLATPAMVASAS